MTRKPVIPRQLQNNQRPAAPVTRPARSPLVPAKTPLRAQQKPPLPPQPARPTVQRKTNANPSLPANARGTVQRSGPTRSAPMRKPSPPPRSSVVQAIKLYPNLHPGAIEPVNHSNVFRLRSFADQYRLHQVNNHGVNVPNQQYNFVRTREGEMLLHNRYRHPSIAEGKQVLYAGEISFNNGKLSWWSNGSGHYQPSSDDAQQANLPMDQFYSYQQIIKGEHTRKKGRKKE